MNLDLLKQVSYWEKEVYTWKMKEPPQYECDFGMRLAAIGLHAMSTFFKV